MNNNTAPHTQLRQNELIIFYLFIQQLLSALFTKKYPLMRNLINTLQNTINNNFNYNCMFNVNHMNINESCVQLILVFHHVISRK